MPRVVKLDLNNPAFQSSWFAMDKALRQRVLDSLMKLSKMDWQQVYRDPGLKWEKVTSVKPPEGVDAIYSLRITQSCCALALREGDFMRMLMVHAEHDASYGKK